MNMDEEVVKLKNETSLCPQKKISFRLKKCIVINIVCRERVLEREFVTHDSPDPFPIGKDAVPSDWLATYNVT